MTEGFALQAERGKRGQKLDHPGEEDRLRAIEERKRALERMELRAQIEAKEKKVAQL